VVLEQKVSLVWSSMLTTSVAYPNAVNAGDLLLVPMIIDNPSTATTFSVSDSLGNTWLHTPFRRCPSGLGFELWYVESSKAGADTVTASQSQLNAISDELSITLLEYSGLRAAGALDAEAGQCAPAPTGNLTSPPINTTGPDLLVALFADPCGGGTMTQGVPWSLIDRNMTWFYLLSGHSNGGRGAAAGAYSATATSTSATSDCWGAAVAAFKLR
jgi:hypothetical protein